MEQKRNTIKPAAERGRVYEFYDNEGKLTQNYALVISSDTRAHDKFVSILMLNDFANGPDVMKVQVKLISGSSLQKCIHCGMVSYAARERLGDIVGTVPNETMNQINNLIAKQLGLVIQTDYKTLYEDLLDRIIKCKNVEDLTLDSKINHYIQA